MYCDWEGYYISHYIINMSYLEQEAGTSVITPPPTQYDNLKKEFFKTGITYKSNEVLSKISEGKNFPYILLI